MDEQTEKSAGASKKHEKKVAALRHFTGPAYVYCNGPHAVAAGSGLFGRYGKHVGFRHSATAAHAANPVY